MTASTRSKAPEGRTTSRVRSKQAASKTAAKLRKARRSAPKSVLDGPKVFAKPEFQLPYRLAMYQNAPGKHRAIPAPLWLQVAILSGLVEMVSPDEAKDGDELLKPINKRHPLKRMKPGELERLMLKGMAEALPYLQTKPAPDPTEKK